MEMISRMLKLPLWTTLVILAALLACGEQTPTQGGAVATVPRPHGSRNISTRTWADGDPGTRCRDHGITTQLSDAGGDDHPDTETGDTWEVRNYTNPYPG